MIIVKLIGGLGNQMFQYALGRALSISHKVPLRLDISDFSSYVLHQGFELDRIFKGNIELATTCDLRDIIGWRSHKSLRSLLFRPILRWSHGQRLIVEPHSHYWEGIKNLSTPCYLSGYWQSDRYFSKYAPFIRDDFTFTQPFSGRNRDLAQEIGGKQSISLHIRRGDYVSNPKTLKTHGICSLEYYRLAVAYMAERVVNPIFYVFSDDPEWVRASLVLDYPMVFVDNNRGQDSFNDMHLMSLCKHNIIANSTFSWWAAWLNSNFEKIVITPREWLKNPHAVTDYKKYLDDLIPRDWIEL
jgi:hypothetical protein